MQLMIVTGMSGAGKSKAINALEDIGYYCVDNLPPQFLPELVHLCQTRGDASVSRIAVVVDARSREMFRSFFQMLDQLKGEQVSYKILFLDASDKVLLQRYKETRRRHPLLGDKALTLQDALRMEREMLEPVRKMADYTVDTSLTASSQFKERLLSMVEQGEGQPMLISCMSFGFRNGLPPEADLVFDVRCLPNPFYIPELREHTGQEDCVRDYVMKWPQTQELLSKLEDLLKFLTPMYVAEGKSQLVIAVGCTGGRHRSVAVAEHLGKYLRQLSYHDSISHRDKDKPVQG